MYQTVAAPQKYREGYSEIGGTEGLVVEAEWSDLFFNHEPAEQAWHDEIELLAVAKDFIRLYPACPYTAKWLRWEFIHRL